MSQEASVLEVQPPRFGEDEASAIALRVFGIECSATALGSERDQAFMLEDGAAGAVLKISNRAESPAVLDFEDAAVRRVLAVDPALPVAPQLAPRGSYEGHQVRIFARLEGVTGGPDLPDVRVHDYTQTLARLALALRSFFHPAAGRELLWDLRQTASLRPLLDAIENDERRALAARVVDRFESRVAPAWPRLRAQVVHNDFNLDNILLDGEERVSGILDFGDCAHGALVADLAVAVASLMRGRPSDDIFRIARLAIDGYASRTPLEPLELELLGDLVAARLAMICAISAWRVRRFPENAAYIQAWDDDSWPLLAYLDELGPETVAAELGGTSGTVVSSELAERRARTTGRLLTALTYSRPVHVVRGEGVWLFDADGTRLLDAYNNVPVVGHCHPRVTEAVVRQTRTLNTHARYLYEPLVHLAERLLATLPAELGLDTVMLVNSGSEANDLAWRIATSTTGHTGALVTEEAYHGVTTAIAELSPEEWPEGTAPGHVARFAPPGTGAQLAAELDEAIEGLRGGLAATFLDGALTSDGIFTPGSEEIRLLVERTHAAGGLYVADEVQAGHGRTGPGLWSFLRHGVVPDLVTLGKPMGNGYPVAALITRGDLANRFPYAGHTFSTFGGNPVAASAALAVLEVLADERLPERAAGVGQRLRAAIAGLGKRDIVDVRGSGLLIGVQLSGTELTRRVVDDLREAGILVGRTGRADDVIKIRPPLVFGDEHAAILVEALDRSLT